MNELPLVTIVVISYNQGKYIIENLDSIKNQTYPNIQLILADDASTDNSVEVFDAWLETNTMQAIKNYHQKNTGLATVLNECTELATGKYIKMIAADDFLHPEAIEKCVQKLEVLGDEYGMVFTDTFAVDEESHQIADIADYNSLGMVDPHLFRNELLKSNRIAALTVLMRKKVLEATGSYDSEFLIEDYYRWLKISQNHYIAYIPEKLAYYRIHETNISTDKADRIQEESIFLNMNFDKDGYARNEINHFFNSAYANQKKISGKLIRKYFAYPYKIKRLSYALRFNIPYSAYKSFHN